MISEFDENTIFIRTTKFWDTGEQTKEIVRAQDSHATIEAFERDERGIWNLIDASTFHYREGSWPKELNNLLIVGRGSTQEIWCSDTYEEFVTRNIREGATRIGSRLHESFDSDSHTAWASSIGASPELRLKVNSKPVALFRGMKHEFISVPFDSADATALKILAQYSVICENETVIDYQLVEAPRGDILIRVKGNYPDEWVTTRFNSVDLQDAFDSWVAQFKKHMLAIGHDNIPYTLGDLDGSPATRLLRLVEQYPSGVEIQYRPLGNDGPEQLESFKDFRAAD